MNQALHILRKDIRCLWAPLLIALAVQSLFVFFEMRPHRGYETYLGIMRPEALVDFLLPVAWWYLVVALVHEEKLVGDRQFWVTRPYRWKSLLAAKALFIATFVNLPVLIADCLILTAQGFSIAGHWHGVLWRQIPFTTAILLPPLALASLTRNLGQVVVAILLVVLRIILSSLPLQRDIPPGYTAVDWIEGALGTIVLLAVLAAVVLMQYRIRWTWLARALLLAVVIVPGFSIPLRWQLDWQTRVKPPAIDASAVRIALDSSRSHRSLRGVTREARYVYADFPVTVTGTPPGVILASNQAEVTIGKDTFVEGATLGRDKSGYYEGVMIPVAVFKSLGGRPVGIRIRSVVTALRQTEFRIPLESGPARVPYLGICESWQPYPELLAIDCRWPLRTPPGTHIHADYPGWDVPDSWNRTSEQVLFSLTDSPFPADFSLSPVRTAQVFSLAGKELAAAKTHPGAQIVFRTDHPLAHFETEIDLKPVRLEDYVVIGSAE